MTNRNQNKIIMKKTVTYKASGLVLGNTWGGGRGTYATVSLEAATKEELLAEAKYRIEENTLDNGMGFENLIGAVLSVTKQTSIEFEGEEYTNEKYEIEVVGVLTEDEIDWLQENVLENLYN